LKNLLRRRHSHTLMLPMSGFEVGPLCVQSHYRIQSYECTSISVLLQDLSPLLRARFQSCRQGVFIQSCLYDIWSQCFSPFMANPRAHEPMSSLNSRHQNFTHHKNKHCLSFTAYILHHVQSRFQETSTERCKKEMID
jgi:hypothetical protein